MWVLVNRSRPKWCIGQTQKIELFMLTRPIWPKFVYWPGYTDQDEGVGEIKKTKKGIKETDHTRTWYSTEKRNTGFFHISLACAMKSLISLSDNLTFNNSFVNARRVQCEC